jgi:hypothetical protein
MTVTQLGRVLLQLSADSKEGKRAAEELGKALEDLGKKALTGAVNLEGLSRDQLQALDLAASNAVARLGSEMGARWQGQVAALRAQIAAALSKAVEGASEDVGKGTAAGGKGKGGPRIPLSPEQLKALRDEFVKSFGDAVPATIDETTAALVRMAQKLTELGAKSTEVQAAIKPFLDQLKELQDRAFEAALEQAQALGPEQALDALAAIRQRITETLPQDSDQSAKAIAQRARLKAVDEAIAKVNLQLVAEYKAQADATAEVLDNTGGIGATTAKVVDDQGDMLRQIADIARGALGIAQAFGLVDDHVLAVLNNLVTVGSTIGPLIDQIKTVGKSTTNEAGNIVSAFNPGKFLSAAIPVIGGLAGLLGGLFGGGPSPQELEDRRIRKENTDALRKLTTVVGEWSLSITGTQYTGAQQAVEALLGATRNELTRAGPKGTRLDLFGRDLTRRANQLLSAAGAEDLATLQDFAKELGITLNTSSTTEFIKSLHQLDEALKATELTKFADTFTGQMDLLNAQLAFWDVTDPIDKLQRLLKVLANPPHEVTITNPDGTTTTKTVGVGSPAIQALLQGLDIANAQDREEFNRRLEELFTRLSEGQLTPAELGGLTPQEFLDQLLQLRELLKEAGATGEAGGLGQQQGVSVVQTITETTAGRMIGIWLQQSDLLSEIRDNTALLKTIAGAGGALGEAASLMITIQQVTVGPGIAAVDAGAELGRGLVSVLDQQLSLRYTRRKVLSGDTVVST